MYIGKAEDTLTYIRLFQYDVVEIMLGLFQVTLGDTKEHVAFFSTCLILGGTNLNS